MVCDDPYWLDGVIIDDGKPIRIKHSDRILKTVAAYLLERERKGRSEMRLTYEPVNFSDITMWAFARTRLSSNYYNYIIDERPLFEFKSCITGNLKKIKPDEEWFERCGWKLIDATESDDALDKYLESNPYAVFFADTGGASFIHPDLRYKR